MSRDFRLRRRGMARGGGAAPAGAASLALRASRQEEAWKLRSGVCIAKCH